MFAGHVLEHRDGFTSWLAAATISAMDDFWRPTPITQRWIWRYVMRSVVLLLLLAIALFFFPLRSNVGGWLRGSARLARSRYAAVV